MTSEPDLAEAQGTVPEWMTLRRQLGVGAFGVVYEAWDARRRMTVALKTLREFDASDLFDLKHEFRTMADVVHPNLVGLYDLVEVRGRWFVTMELVAGTDLVTYVGGRDAHAVRRAFAQLADAVDVLHGAGILHRDLKPSNVLVTAEHRVVVLDFGLALSPVRRWAPTDGATGSWAYMSPEQACGETIEEAADVYSLGVMLYQVLGGRELLAGTPSAILHRKLQFDPRPPAVLVPDAPPDLNALCVDLLRRDPRDRPSAAVVARRLAADARPTTTGDGPRFAATLVGRAEPLARLHEAFATARRGGLVAVRLHGRSGIGKSRLAFEFCREVRRSSAEVVLLTGRCHEQEAIPYKALDGVIDDVGQYLRGLSAEGLAELVPPDAAILTHVFPSLRDVLSWVPAAPGSMDELDAVALRRRAAGALRALMLRMGARHPLVVFVDDVQWGDLDSLVLLRELLRPPAPPALMLVLAYRSEDAESSPFVRELHGRQAPWADAGEEREIALGELSDEEAGALAGTLLGPEMAPDDRTVRAIVQYAAGHPLFVAQLAWLVTSGRATELGALSLDEVIGARVHSLPAAARHVLEMVAVAGRPIGRDLIGGAAGLASAHDPVFGALCGSHLLRSANTDGSVETFHDRIRRVVVEGLDPPSLRGHHRELAGALLRSGRGDAEALSMHFEGAGDRTTAATYAGRAADVAAAALAFDRASELYRRALHLDPSDAATIGPLQAKLAGALANAGHGAAAADAYLAAARPADRTSGLELRRRAAEQFLVSGHIDEGLAVLRELLDSIGMRLARSPRRAIVAVLARQAFLRLRGLRFVERSAESLDRETLIRLDTCWSVAIGLSLADTLHGADFVLRHLLLALRAGEPYRVARALALWLGGSVVRGRRSAQRTARIAAAMWQAAARANHPYATGLAGANSAAVLSFQGRFADSLAMGDYAEGVLRAGCTGVRWELDTLQIFRLHSFVWMGRYAELAERVPEVLRDADAHDDRYLGAYVRTRCAYLVHLARDRPAAARDSVRDGVASWSPAGFQVQHYWHWLASVEIDLYEGRPNAAWARVEERWRALERSGLPYIQAILVETRWLRARAALALAAARERDAEPLLRRAERDLARIDGERVAWGAALAALGRAALTCLRGARGAALVMIAAAEDRCRALDLTHYATAARRRQGELLGGDVGRVLVGEADRAFAAESVRDPGRMTAVLVPGIAADE